jgi:phage baseplate assembly protein W
LEKTTISDDIPYVPESVLENDSKMREFERKYGNRFSKLLDMPLKDIIDLWDKSQTRGENGKILTDDYWLIPIVIREIFHIADTKDINESISEIKDTIDALDAKLRNHRHDTTKQFSAKPEF